VPPLRRGAADKEAEGEEIALEMDVDKAEDRTDRRARVSRVTPKV
jgi:hypothetical protein